MSVGRKIAKWLVEVFVYFPLLLCFWQAMLMIAPVVWILVKCERFIKVNVVRRVVISGARLIYVTDSDLFDKKEHDFFDEGGQVE